MTEREYYALQRSFGRWERIHRQASRKCDKHAQKAERAYNSGRGAAFRRHLTAARKALDMMQRATAEMKAINGTIKRGVISE